MKALILNSGMGSRMGDLTRKYPKCMSELLPNETIVSRQLRLLDAYGVSRVVMTTGRFADELTDYCATLPGDITFVHNPIYDRTNYIYSIYCAREQLRDDDILLLHGDLVFDSEVLEAALKSENSCMTVSSRQEILQKDFKAVIRDGRIMKVGVEYFDQVLMAQPMYMLRKEDWHIWLDKICEYCQRGETGCYAEKALGEVSERMNLTPLDVGALLCAEVDTPEELEAMSRLMEERSRRTVYMSFSSDVLHSGHFAILRKAATLGRLVVGVLTDEAVAGYKRYPAVPYAQRVEMLRSIRGVSRVVEQSTLSYREVVERLRPDIVVHGDDWRHGVQRPVRDELVNLLAAYGGRLVEYPYAWDADKAAGLDRLLAAQSIPDVRRGRLRRLLQMKPLLSVIEAHSGITGLIAEKTVVYQQGQARQFDGMWVSSLCDSTAKGKPDIELVDMSSRMRTIDDIMEVTTKPIILDGDTGGLIEHFVYNVRTLERMGVSAVIIEDKTGLKKNSLFGTDVPQTQDSIENFCAKIAAGKAALKTREFMIIARIESLILERGMEDALARAFAYVQAGADGIMIHSRRREPDEIFEFIRRFREKDAGTYLVVVPTSFNQVTEEEFASRGVNMVIYANHLTRSGFPAMQKTAEMILTHHRAREADEAMCMPIKDILTLIPEEF